MIRPFASTACGLVVAAVVATSMPATAFEHAIIGADAPPLDIAHWLQDREGAFKPVKEFTPGKVYVIEFWATWCGPCIMSMPHLAELQDAYADKGVTVIGVSDEKVEDVRGFLEQQTPDVQATYGEITKKYCLTIDPDGSVHKDYMAAAQEGGVPTAFIVGKTGKIEWIGHPDTIDEPLESIVAGTWDRTSFVADEKELDAMGQAIQMALQGPDPQQAIPLMDQLIAGAKRPGVKRRLEQAKAHIAEIVAAMAASKKQAGDQ